MSEGTSATAIGSSGWRSVSRYQWLVFLVVWLGWTLDAADFGLYSLVLRPALTVEVSQLSTSCAASITAANSSRLGGDTIAIGAVSEEQSCSAAIH